MKREEALRIIKECKEKGFKHTFYTLNEYHTALDIAIKALEQEPILNKIRAEIEQLPTTKCTETQRIYMDATDFKKNVLAILNKYKAESEEV